MGRGKMLIMVGGSGPEDTSQLAAALNVEGFEVVLVDEVVKARDSFNAHMANEVTAELEMQFPDYRIEDLERVFSLERRPLTAADFVIPEPYLRPPPKMSKGAKHKGRRDRWRHVGGRP
jgi:phage replication-related protein YjqB (UPF0714/DUF867 family)